MKKYYKYELNMTIMNILSIVLVIIPIIVLRLFGYNIYYIENIGLFFLGLILYFMIHELLHGLGYMLFAKDKKNIKYGIALDKGVLFAACQESLNKKQILISLMLPLSVLTFIALPVGMFLNQNWLVFYAIMNFGGAIGDILMTYLIAHAPKDVQYIDYNTDIGAYLLSKEDMSNYKSFGFRLTESGDAKVKEVDKSIKKFYVSKFSIIILGMLIIFSVINIIANVIK